MKEEIIDASRQQIQFWKYHTQDGESKVLHVVSLEFELIHADIASVERSLGALQKRHESLRTYLKLMNGEVRQCVLPYSPELFSPLYFDVSEEDDAGKAKAAIKAGIAGTLNNIGVPPLTKSCIIRYPDRRHVVCILIHHVISDEWSKIVIYRELSRLYDCFLNGTDADSNPHPMQLRDYVRLERECMNENGKTASQYWRAILGRSSQDHLHERLVAGRGCPGKPPERAIGNGNVTYSVYGPDFSAVRQLSKDCNCSMFAVISTSVQLLFYLLAGKKPILISAPFANRHLPGTETVIGWLAGTIYLNRQLNDGMTVREAVKAGYIDFLKACRYPIHDHHELGLHDNLEFHTDLFMNFMGKELGVFKTIGKPDPERHYIEDDGCFFDLVLVTSEFEDGLYFRWMYNVGLYSMETVSYMLARYKKLLRLMCENAGSPIERLEECLLQD